MIPKIIWTIWLNEDKRLPAMIDRCFKSRSIPGYEHRVITLENCYKGSDYIKRNIDKNLKEKQWAEAVDYLRVYYTHEYGGIYLDADMEVLPGKNFDHILDNRIFLNWNTIWVSNNVIGSEPGHPFLSNFLKEVESKWKGDDKDLMAKVNVLWAIRGIEWHRDHDDMEIFPQDVFTSHYYGYPIYITNDTLVYHFGLGSWYSGYPNWPEFEEDYKKCYNELNGEEEKKRRRKK